ncbi:hypothetical protein FQA47_006523 [Oryzias melastigma]|uniref:Uncharacterized protein n=1 Tax=Oryzias melastigma TaxID=30732 RepID=A0A834C4B5_ORYME|nr:hypothetical protein FQA47_006523 [Oryzias melastigma]
MQVWHGALSSFPAAVAPASAFLLTLPRADKHPKTRQGEGKVSAGQVNHNNDPLLTKTEWISQSIPGFNEIRESAPTWVAAAWYLSLISSGSSLPVSCPPDVEEAPFRTGRMPPAGNNGRPDARSPAPLSWSADSLK